MSRSQTVNLLTVTAVWLATSTGMTTAQSGVRVTLDGYTYNSTLNPSATLPLGISIALVCRVVGLPHGTPTTYTWTCPSGPCNSRAAKTQHTSRRLTAPNRLIVTIIHQQMDSGIYTCTVNVSGQRDIHTGQFSLKVEGGVVLLSTHEVLPDNTIIRNKSTIQTQYGQEQLTDNNTGTIFCLGKGSPTFHYKNQEGREAADYSGSGEQPLMVLWRSESVTSLQMNDLSQTPIGKICCRAGTAKACAYIFLNDQKSLQIPTVKETKQGILTVTPRHQSHVASVHRVDVGLTHTLATRSKALLSLMALPAGVSYRVSVLATKGGETSNEPANLVVKGQGPPISAFGYSLPRSLTVTRALPDGIELSWLPPKDMHTQRYQVTYSTAEDFSSFNYSKPFESTGDTVYYNLTGLAKGRRYYIMVAALFTTHANNTAVTYARETLSHYVSDSSQLTNLLSLAITIPFIVVLALAVDVLASVLLWKRAKRCIKKKAKNASSSQQPEEVTVEGSEGNIYEAIDLQEKEAGHHDGLKQEDAPLATVTDSAGANSEAEEYTPMDY